jgi:predicted nucleic acid-binding protein
MRVFLDTNILLDVIESRTGLVEESAAVLTLAEVLQVDLYIAWHSLATIYYLIRRGRSEQAAMTEVDQILAWANVAPVDSRSAARARNLNFPDFEDAMQCVCAENCLAEFIVTRNTRDFTSSPIPVLSPSEFLTRHASL